MSQQNNLAGSASPYLLQHAYNPVNWYPWGQEALQKARAENKLIIVSVGYSACHWCHVMERESFENEKIAEIMNAHFISIKVDREERPDVDQVYMDAVQLMTGRGGWPLNCICLPDQRPVYGGTYFTPKDWANVLLNLSAYWQEKPGEAVAYAEKLTEGIASLELFKAPDAPEKYAQKELAATVDAWKRNFDYHKGGNNRAPKFPMPNNWHFLLRYGHVFNDEVSLAIVNLTLNAMALGGIYDHIGGGFARYAVDERWHVPHFEKMLYDNAQLMSLYSEAYTATKNPLYKEVVDETFAWMKREMLSPAGGFYAALDADSEGVEGKFYTWSKDEINAVLKDDAGLFCRYFHVTGDGNWEEEATNVLFRSGDDELIGEDFGLDDDQLAGKIRGLKEKLFEVREKRIRPGLDNKIIASWNGLALRGLCEAYRAFYAPEYLDAALQTARFLCDRMSTPDGRLLRTAGSPQSGFLDDHAFVADGLIALYEVTFNERWLRRAAVLCDLAMSRFYDEKSGMFFFTSGNDEKLIARKQETMDNVIPASNSQMARNLTALAAYLNKPEYKHIADRQLQIVYPQLRSYPSAFSNWMLLLLGELEGCFDVVITGNNAENLRAGIEQHYIPLKHIMGGAGSSLPPVKEKTSGEPNIYVCVNKTCALPVRTSAEAVEQMRKRNIDTK